MNLSQLCTEPMGPNGVELAGGLWLYDKVKNLDRQNVIKKSTHTKKEDELIFLISTLKGGFDGMKELVNKNLDILSWSSTTKTEWL